jgi:hypothetical protein
MLQKAKGKGGTLTLNMWFIYSSQSEGMKRCGPSTSKYSTVNIESESYLQTSNIRTMLYIHNQAGTRIQIHGHNHFINNIGQQNNKDRKVDKYWSWTMPFSGMLCHVAPSQKTAYFIVTAMKTTNLTNIEVADNEFISCKSNCIQLIANSSQEIWKWSNTVVNA